MATAHNSDIHQHNGRMDRCTGRSGLTGAALGVLRPVWPVACGSRGERVGRVTGVGSGV